MCKHQLSLTPLFPRLVLVTTTLTLKVGRLDVHDNGDMMMDSVATQLPPGYSPVLCAGGLVTCQLSNAQLGTVLLASHEAIHSR